MFKRSGLKRFRIRRFNFKFQIQNHRRNDQREDVLFRVFSACVQTEKRIRNSFD